MKFDFDRPDPRTGMYPRIKPKREEDDICLMSRMPSRSCWIKMLQNRVNLKSVGNIREAERVWFDRRTMKVSKNVAGEGAIDFRMFRLKSGQKPQGWIECR